MALKSKELITSNSIMRGLLTGQYLVKLLSNPLGLLHAVSAEDKSIDCNKEWLKDQRYGYCGHSLPVPIKQVILEKYAKILQRTSVARLIQTDSWNIDSKKVGRKKTEKLRKRNELFSPGNIIKTSTANFYPRKATYLPYGRHQS